MIAGLTITAFCLLEHVEPVSLPEQTIKIALDEPVESSPPDDKHDLPKSGETAFKRVTISLPASGEAQTTQSHLDTEPVSFVEPLKNADVTEGDDVIFDCIISGSSPLGIQWYKNKEPVSSDEQKYFIEAKHKELRLTVKNATPDDIGDYRCTVGNDRSQASSDAHLNVKPNPSTFTPPEFNKVPQDAVSVEGNTVKFEAKVSGHPKPEVVWLKEDKPVHPDPRHQIQDEGDVHSLVITNCTPDDSAEYTLEAKNDAGLATCPFSLTLKEDNVPPKFIKKLQDTSLKTGSPLELTTTFVGTPEPEITWFLDGEPLSTNSVCEVSTQDGTSRLFIDQLEPEDAGDYKCIARNNAGKTTTGCSVIVNDLQPGILFFYIGTAPCSMNFAGPSIRDDPNCTFGKNSLELIEQPSVNIVRIV